MDKEDKNKEKKDRYAWLRDKDSEKYKEYIKKKKEGMRKAHRRRLEAKNKRPPKKVLKKYNKL